MRFHGKTEHSYIAHRSGWGWWVLTIDGFLSEELYVEDETHEERLVPYREGKIRV